MNERVTKYVDQLSLDISGYVFGISRYTLKMVPQDSFTS